jgi:DNA repair protein RecO (recombination protein O)
MLTLATPAVLLRRIDYGDFDLILTFFTEATGKISVIAKHAKKSKKRFAGVLELFTILNITCQTGRRAGLPVLQEALLEEPFAAIRESMLHTAYASYWAELVATWAEEAQQLDRLYRLLVFVLAGLDRQQMDPALLNLMFQMRFLDIAGLCPNLHYCCVCKRELDALAHHVSGFDFPRGGLRCHGCGEGDEDHVCLSRGTIKQLQWLAQGDLTRMGRLRFSSQGLQEAQQFLDAFVPFHLGKEPRSLKFLRRIRPAADTPGREAAQNR